MNTSDRAHPQANGLVERANRSLMEGIKTRLGPQSKQSNGETPFSLTYGSEAVIPAEIGIPSYRTLMIREEYNEEEQRLNLEVVVRNERSSCLTRAQYKTKEWNSTIKEGPPNWFLGGRVVYRRNQPSSMENEGKLGPKWEALIRVTEAFENGSYKLQTMKDKVVPRTWHAVNLRKCYL
ncbi:reverse transcriptase domain-containing protein [Tanacetum coccineum]